MEWQNFVPRIARSRRTAFDKLFSFVGFCGVALGRPHLALHCGGLDKCYGLTVVMDGPTAVASSGLSIPRFFGGQSLVVAHLVAVAVGIAGRYDCAPVSRCSTSALLSLFACFGRGVWRWFWTCFVPDIGDVFARSQGSGSGFQCWAVYHRLRSSRVLCAPL